MTVTVIGVDGGSLPPGATEVLNAAELVVGTREQLRSHAPEGARTVELGSLGPAMNALSALTGDEVGVVFASGDPGFFGAVRALRSKGLRCSVLPAVSSVQRLMARVGRSWDDVTVVSTRAGGLHRALNVCRAHPAVVVLTSSGAGPARLAAGLSGWRRTMVVGEDLGGAHERVTTVDPAEAAGRTWLEPNVVFCVRDPDAVPVRGWHGGGEPVPPAGWGLAEKEFSHRQGEVSGSELRALALSRLAPRPGSLVWDVGAGCGAVAVECARMGAAVVAVEEDEAQAVRLVSNATSHGVDVRVVEGRAPEVLRELPKPDSVFVGVADPEVLAGCAHVGAERVVLVLEEFDRVKPSRDILRNAGYVVDGIQFCAHRIAETEQGRSRLAAAEPVLLLFGRRFGEEGT
ncbi:precorrin-6y C5,15-methyltransferase (decarboxylating) subunit CbiE [Actinopolyspora mortivallis]|uniref:precorrin-6y C5,15-methyltransferase (decarboxylating) subunit CbiE n=1 Tax=Actinopolyspora mortivallis TaxID=33906 RepID=UPI000373DFFC|nr:precorrin-6y C5,15-methyltransferase (decarboxylating) subunit CbiE [Actinopolyspora mortivallis]